MDKSKAIAGDRERGARVGKEPAWGSTIGKDKARGPISGVPQNRVIGCCACRARCRDVQENCAPHRQAGQCFEILRASGEQFKIRPEIE